MTLIAGVDGCKGGWLIVACPPFRFGEARARIAATLDATKSNAMTVIDMPVGLPDGQEVPRLTDRAARRFLRDRNRGGHASPGSRVFAAPSRVALGLFRTGLEYHAVNAGLTGPKMSQQAFHITGKISEVDDWMTPARQQVAREGHPEVAFAALTGQTLPPKKSLIGAAARDLVLGDLGFDLSGMAAMLGAKARRWAPDDLRDACVLAWVASRVAAGEHMRFPEMPDTDARGLRMEIVA